MNASKTTIDRHYERHAPELPLPWPMVENAQRCLGSLRQAVTIAQKLLDDRATGCGIEINGKDIAGIGKLDRARIFGLVWPAVLANIAYWATHATRYVVLPDNLRADMERVRLEIDELQNS